MYAKEIQNKFVSTYALQLGDKRARKGCDIII